PSGGWGYQWAPHPGRGIGVDQPGGWSYSLLPYLELGTLRDLGASADPNSMTEPEPFVKVLYETPCAIWSCPSRRPSVAHPLPSSASAIARKPFLCATLTHQILIDYAANAGDFYIPWPPGPTTLIQGDSGTYNFGSSKNGTGIMAAHFFTRMNDITDGTSHTYLVGEKYLDPDAYEGGISKGDNQGPYTSEDEDSSRWAAVSGTSTTLLPPMQDRAGVESTIHFGSAHPGSLNMGMCDGSVSAISYDIDPLAHQYMANRQDGNAISLEK
ncbi:MAG TPA: hypothetical protein DD670_19700, partial [Planctomycetaceae bacterium]|nr:hypothetical protein [Planctomycetaceae bacterium]